MNFRTVKLFLGAFILFAYINIGVFGLLQFNHMAETPMANCPYTGNSFSLCENSLDHINNWRQFSNATTTLLLWIFSLLAFWIILYFFDRRNFLNQKQYFYKWKYYLYNNKLYRLPNRLIKWLSLFENSPSFST